MKIFINGEEYSFEKEFTLEELIQNLKINKDTTVVEINETIINRNNYPNIFLKNGDKVEIITFVGGG
jgi:thiamine biosynthesis protein ThiS